MIFFPSNSISVASTSIVTSPPATINRQGRIQLCPGRAVAPGKIIFDEYPYNYVYFQKNERIYLFCPSLRKKKLIFIPGPKSESVSVNRDLSSKFALF
jgi:hypothetical protein